MTSDADNLALIRESVLADPVCSALLDRLPALGLSEWWLTGGCVFQNVWNARCGRPAGSGIKDYDVFYFDASDLSWEAEDAVIHAVGSRCADLGATVEVKNEARAHVWSEAKWGRPVAPLTSAAQAIAHFAATCCAIGITRDADGELRIYAPYGVRDIVDMTMRPTPGSDLRRVFEEKWRSYRQRWPGLRVVAWDAPALSAPATERPRSPLAPPPAAATRP